MQLAPAWGAILRGSEVVILPPHTEQGHQGIVVDVTEQGAVMLCVTPYKARPYLMYVDASQLGLIGDWSEWS